MSNREAEYTEFVASRHAHLRRVAYAVCGDWNDADDLLQQALVKLYVAWPRVRRRDHPEAYVRQIIVRTNIDEHRRVRHTRERVGLDGVPEPAYESGEDHAELFEALQALPEQQRKVVVLRHWLGLSVRETAAELGIREGTVKAHSHRGLAALQALLATAR